MSFQEMWAVAATIYALTAVALARLAAIRVCDCAFFGVVANLVSASFGGGLSSRMASARTVRDASSMNLLSRHVTLLTVAHAFWRVLHIAPQLRAMPALKPSKL